MNQEESNRSLIFSNSVLVAGSIIALSWLLFPVHYVNESPFGPLPDTLVSMFLLMFMLSPLIVLMFIHRYNGLSGVTVFLKDRWRVRCHALWYLVSVFLFPILAMLSFGVFVVIGGNVPAMSEDLPYALIGVFSIGFIANLIENYAWRGYLQEAFQRNHSVFVSSLLVGIVWGLWHVPLLVIPEAPLEELPILLYMVLIIGLSIIFGWVYDKTKSVVHVTVMHTIFNSINAVIVVSIITATLEISLFIAIYTLHIWLVVLGVVFHKYRVADGNW